MPPAFVLSQDQTLKFDVHPSAGGITDVRAAHFKEPFLHKSYMVCKRHIGTAYYTEYPTP